MKTASLKFSSGETLTIPPKFVQYAYYKGVYLVDPLTLLVVIYHAIGLHVKYAHIVSDDTMSLRISRNGLDTEVSVTLTYTHERPVTLALVGRTFGHEPAGRPPVEGECIKKFGVVRENGGRVVMYAKSNFSHTWECNEYGIPTHEPSSYWNTPVGIREYGSPLHMEMDGWFYVRSSSLRKYQVPNKFTFEDARILYAGDPNSTNNYNPC
jgi:hypothetical protein